MKHARQVIREEVASMLVGITGVSFPQSKLKKLADAPAITIYTGSESSEPESRDSINGPRRYSRFVNLNIELVLEADASGLYENEADGFAAEIESAMAADLTLNGSATDSELIGTEQDIDELSEGHVLSMTVLNYRVWYRTTASDPETAIG